MLERAEIPVFDANDPAPCLELMMHVVWAQNLAAVQAAITGDHTATRQLFSANLLLLQMLRNANVPVIHYLVVCALKKTTESWIVTWAWELDAPSEPVQIMLDSISKADDEVEAYQRILRVEFTDFILPGMDAMRLATNWTTYLVDNQELYGIYPNDLQRPLAIIHDPRLVTSHPNPYDRVEGIRFADSRFHRYAEMVKSDWSLDQLYSLYEETDEISEKFLKDIQRLMASVEDEDLPLSAEALERAKRHYLKIKNPVGRFWQASTDVLGRSSVRVFEARMNTSALRILLALRLYYLEEGRLPARLKDLAEAGFLSEVPLDPFSGQPFLYSPERALLWSVGENGADDGGEHDDAWKDDVLWPIAIPSRQR